jgi:hypothetical protein
MKKENEQQARRNNDQQAEINELKRKMR